MVFISRNAIAYFLGTFLLVATFINAQTPTAAPPANQTTNSPTKVSNATVAPFEPVSVTIDSILITFIGARMVPDSDLLQFQAIMEIWFEAYFNQEVESRRNYRHHHRYLQQFRVSNVRNMDTVYTVVSQDASETNRLNDISFIQKLSYDTTSDPGKPQGYALLPFDDLTYKALLLNQLVTNIDSMIQLSAIYTPIIEPRTIQTSDSLSTGGIVGVVLAAVLGLALMVYVGFFIGTRNMKQSSELNITNSKGNEDAGENHVGEIKEEQNSVAHAGQSPIVKENQQSIPIATDENRRRPDPPTQQQQQQQQQAKDDYVVQYKDQTRTVITPEVVEAIPVPKNQSNDSNGSSSSNVPIASLVAI